MEISAPWYAVSGLSANAVKAAVAAHNISNINTDEFKTSRADLQENVSGRTEATITWPASHGPFTAHADGFPVDLAGELVQLKIAEHGYKANIAVIRAQDEMLGTVLDIVA